MVAAGARILVAGSAIFHTPDPERATRELEGRRPGRARRGALACRPLSSPRSASRVRVRYAETDKMGVVYYANYFVWFEVGRTDLLRDAGWSYREMEATGVALPVIEAHCEYRQSARYDDELEVRTIGHAAVARAGARSTTRSCGRPTTRCIATGRTVHAALDPAGRPCRLPEPVRALLPRDAR